MLVIILIIVLFASLVILHEFGHFVSARRSGVAVDEFGVGFGPKLLGRVVKGTLYSVNLLPLGGFVRLRGEDEGATGPHTFASASVKNKTKILLAGVGMNLLTAFVILYGLCVTAIPGLGSPFEPKFLPSTTVQPKQLLVADVSKGSPAEKAGIKVGDYVISGNGQKLSTETDLKNFTKANAGNEVTLHVSSNGDERDVQVKLLAHPPKNSGYLGVGPQQVYKLRYNPLTALAAAAYITAALFVATIWGVLVLLVSIPLLIFHLFAGGVPAAADSASGPIGIFFIFKSISVLGYGYIFLFMANIAVALAAFNVLPIPALDGGRLAIIQYQHWFKRKIKPETEARIHAIGFIALIAFIVLITVYDVRKQLGG
jgi:regulator of sigma E protease